MTFISGQRDSIIALEQDDVRKHDSDKYARTKTAKRKIMSYVKKVPRKTS